jgi:hypothetical protein
MIKWMMALLFISACNAPHVPRAEWIVELKKGDEPFFSYNVLQDKTAVAVPYSTIEIDFDFPEMIKRDGVYRLSRKITLKEDGKTMNLVLFCHTEKPTPCALNYELPSGTNFALTVKLDESHGVVGH